MIFDHLKDNAYRTPNKVAFADERRELTYFQLMEESLHIAQYIINQGIIGSPIAILLGRCVECIPSLFGILSSGNYYCILNGKTNLEYNKRILDFLIPSIIITDDEGKEKLVDAGVPYKIATYAECMETDVDRENVIRCEKNVLLSDPMFVVFTSGSTGIPKGVITPYSSVTNFYEMAVEFYGITPEDIFGNQYALHTVGCIEEIFYTVRTGATTYIIPSEMFYSPLKLVNFISEKKITILNWIPSAMEIVARYGVLSRADLSAIRLVTFGGERISSKTVKTWRNALPNTLFFNAYGSTETTELVTFYLIEREFEDDEVIPIGKPYPNARIYIKKVDGIDSEDGSVGELCVMGDSLAYGYYKNFDLTKKRFVQNPNNKCYKEIMYCTGDLVRIKDGELIYLGRIDEQIKKSGFRIELGEIEYNVAQCNKIKNCACVYNPKLSKIVVFYIGEISEFEIKKFTEERLPRYMHPDRYINIENMPYNGSFKIDKKALEKIAEEI